MHHISHLQIQNFRSCYDIESLALTTFSPLVGYNNAGKSNVLSAIQWLLKKYVLQVGDFFDPARPCVVAVTIDGIDAEVLHALSDDHRQRIERFLQGQRLRIRRVQEQPGGTAAQVKLQVFNPANLAAEEEWVPNPTGIDQAISALFPEPISISAMEDAGRDISKVDRGSTIGKLIEQLMGDLTTEHGDAINDSIEALNRLLSAEGADRAELLRAFDEEATEAVAGFFPGVAVRVDIPAPEVASLFKSGTVRVFESQGENEDPIGRDIASMGHGAQRAIQMALIQKLAERAHAEGGKRKMLLIDEPELYMHPQAIARVRSALKQLAESGYQVVFTTHSPMMIGRDALPHTTILRKTNTGRTVALPNLDAAMLAVFEGNAQAQLDALFNLDSACEILFSDRVLICEGKTEQELLPDLFEATHCCGLPDRRIGLVSPGGSGSIHKCLNILAAMNIEAVAIADLDYAFQHAVSAGYIEADDADLAACTQLFQEIAAAQNGAINPDTGLFRNNGEVKASACYEALAADERARPHIDNLTTRLLERRIWIWSGGAIEAHTGTGPKTYAEWSRFRSRLQADGIGACADRDTIEECMRWVCGPAHA